MLNIVILFNIMDSKGSSWGSSSDSFLINKDPNGNKDDKSNQGNNTYDHIVIQENSNDHILSNI